MSIEGFDFINLANSLLNDEDYVDNEAIFRTIISRAYYGCFLYLIPKLGLSYTTYLKKRNPGEIHQKVIDILKDRDPFSGSLLDSLRKSRNNSDYHPNDDILVKEAQDSLVIAQQITSNI